MNGKMVKIAIAVTAAAILLPRPCGQALQRAGAANGENHHPKLLQPARARARETRSK
jgi:hypothetical protein